MIDSEIMDIDEAARAEGYVSPQLFATAPTPAGGAALQGPKTPGDTGLADIDAALASYSKSMQPDTLYLIGPGTTMSALKARLGNGGTLLGVDAARDGRIIGRDLSACEVEALLKGDDPARITMSVVGGQGFVFGRGNQQFSPTAIRRVGRESIDLICSEQKLAGLHAAALGVDTGDPALDAELCGYWQVTTGPGRRQVVRVTH
jgi:predicted polyphosphate/ATP-dependent NAD kinase